MTIWNMTLTEDNCAVGLSARESEPSHWEDSLNGALSVFYYSIILYSQQPFTETVSITSLLWTMNALKIQL